MTRIRELIRCCLRGPHEPRGRDGQGRTVQGRTDDLIDQAEQTRLELARITDRLAAHVIALKTLTRAYASRQHEGGSGG